MSISAPRLRLSRHGTYCFRYLVSPQFIEQVGKSVPPRLTDAGLAILSSESPRRQRLMLQLAIGSAVFKKASEL